YMENIVKEVSTDYPTHIVAVMGIVRNSKGQILLVQSPRRGWEPPGGQVENGEDVLIALKREVLEESGIKIETGKLVAMYSNVTSIPTKLMLTFEANAVGGKLRTSDESLDVGWFSAEEAVDKITHPAQKHKLLDALQNSEGIIYRVYGNNPYKLFDSKII
ncbi:NUDIX hydrolase, partial [Candidatus Poribacteria bacterium]